MCSVCDGCSAEPYACVGGFVVPRRDVAAGSTLGAMGAEASAILVETVLAAVEGAATGSSVKNALRIAQPSPSKDAIPTGTSTSAIHTIGEVEDGRAGGGCSAVRALATGGGRSASAARAATPKPRFDGSVRLGSSCVGFDRNVVSGGTTGNGAGGTGVRGDR